MRAGPGAASADFCEKKIVQVNIFRLTWHGPIAFLNSMKAAPKEKKARWCWRKDLSEFRGLTDRERTGYLLVLEWFENFRLRYELEAGREAARAFWRGEVLAEGRQREAWQLEQWEDAIKWYLAWLGACAEEGADHRSLPERVRAAVNAACGSGNRSSSGSVFSTAIPGGRETGNRAGTGGQEGGEPYFSPLSTSTSVA